jgi:hypothetical protein
MRIRSTDILSLTLMLRVSVLPHAHRSGVASGGARPRFKKAARRRRSQISPAVMLDIAATIPRPVTREPFSQESCSAQPSDNISKTVIRIIFFMEPSACQSRLNCKAYLYRRGAPVENMSHSASFESFDNAQANAGTKQLGMSGETRLAYSTKPSNGLASCIRCRVSSATELGCEPCGCSRAGLRTRPHVTLWRPDACDCAAGCEASLDSNRRALGGRGSQSGRSRSGEFQVGFGRRPTQNDRAPGRSRGRSRNLPQRLGRVSLLRGGAGTALVGSYSDVADRIAGVSLKRCR